MNIQIQCSWMYNRKVGNDFNPEWLYGVNQFLDYARSQPEYIGNGVLRCPCRKCENMQYASSAQVQVHLFKYGFVADYWYWVSHGEVEPTTQPNINVGPSGSDQYIHDEEDNRYEDIVYDAMRGGAFNCNIGDIVYANSPPNEEAQEFYKVLDSAQRPVFEGCNNQSELSLALQLMSLKSDYNMAQSAFDRNCSIIKSLLPQENLVPNNLY
ncbi:hypothetical protein ACJIZ3_003206 [Penstemon smallii]|uniref:Transposase-associated domain-containing protein n=1 Tax=Penstemon smallii TaxID=265156 RepID=A0ABD3UBH9_9LAMI